MTRTHTVWALLNLSGNFWLKENTPRSRYRSRARSQPNNEWGGSGLTKTGCEHGKGVRAKGDLSILRNGRSIVRTGTMTLGKKHPNWTRWPRDPTGPLEEHNVRN